MVHTGSGSYYSRGSCYAWACTQAQQQTEERVENPCLTRLEHPQGKDTHGPTALINSVTNFPMEEAGNGMVLDIVKFTPSLLEEETGKRALRSLIETYFHKGGMEIQISIVSVETLRAAQEHPENYADLMVSGGGIQVHISARSERQRRMRSSSGRNM